MKSMPFAILSIIASGAFTAATIQPVMAQQTSDNSSAKTQQIEITGSNIRRSDKETPSPIQTITAAELKNSGYTTVSDVLRDITANGQGTLSQSFNGAFAAGASGISLRGLTVGATLVLIDGHRMAAYPLSDDGQRPFVDISSIPFDAVERIDIVKDGASAIYGSDAIAGVVNVVLKKSYDGTNITAETGTSHQGGGKTSHVSLIHGFGDLQKDGYTAYASAEYRTQDPIRLDQRAGKDWTTRNWEPKGGLNLLGGATNILNPLPSTLTPYLFNNANGVLDGNGNVDTNNPANFSYYPGCAGLAAMQAGKCTYTNTWSQLQPKTENLNILASVTKKLGADWQVNVKASMFESKTQVVGGHAAYPNQSYAGNTALGPNIAPMQVGVIPDFSVPAGYPGNPFNGPANIYGLVNGIGGLTDDVDTKSYRLVADLSGSLAGWDVNASAGYTKVVTKQTFSNYVDYTALLASFNSANPFLLSGGNSAATIAAFSPRFSGEQTNELSFLEARASRELMPMAGGELTFSAGGSYIRKNLNSPDSAMAQSGLIGATTAYALGRQTNTAAFLELYAPVLKNLEIDAAVRLDHYDTYGNSSTPKVGFKYAPTEVVTLRGTYSTGFRAPSAAENGTAGSSFFFRNISDPILCADGLPTTAGNVVGACKFQPAYVQVTTKDIQPEKSKSATFGLIVEPVKGWSSTLDYYNIEIKNLIVTASGLPGFQPSYVRGVPQPQTISDGAGGTYIATPATGPILYATSGYVNANSVNTSGIELGTSYRFKLGEYGSLKTDLEWTHTLSYKMVIGGVAYELAGTHGPTIYSGDTGNPKDRAQVTFGYDKGPFNVTTVFNWISSFNVTDPSTGPGANDTCENSLQNSNVAFANTTYPTQYCKIKSFLTTNLTASYQLGKNWTVRGSVSNLFNQSPPLDMQTYGSSGGSTYNPALHQAGAVGRFFNVGANYKF